MAPHPQLSNHCAQFIPTLNSIIPELNKQHILCFWPKLGPCGPSWPQSCRLFLTFYVITFWNIVLHQYMSLSHVLPVCCAWSFIASHNSDNPDTNCCSLPPPLPLISLFLVLCKWDQLFMLILVHYFMYIYINILNCSLIASEYFPDHFGTE